MLENNNRNNAKIIVTSPSFSKNEYLRGELLKIFPNSYFNSKGSRLSLEELKEFIRDADGAIVSLDIIDSKLISECKNLKIISKHGVGLDNIDLDECEKRNIKIGFSSGVNRLSVAEEVIAYMICLCRNIYKTSCKLSEGVWDKSGGFELSGKTVGIIGVGNVGKEVIKLLKPFNCKILVNDIVDQQEYYRRNNLNEASKEEIYRNADFITIHTPLTEKTLYMINEKTLNKMKKSAYLINTARGKIVKLSDLKSALNEETIAGAALDVYEDEPIHDIDLLKNPNLLCTPHIGGNSIEAVHGMGNSAINHLKEFFQE